MTISWESRQSDIREKIKGLGVESFLNWSVILATMHVGENVCVEKKRKIVAPLIDKYGLHDIGPNQVYQLHHIKVLLERFPDAMEVSSVVEIGAGYGDMALLFRRMGYRGRYAIHDFPELRLIQNHHLFRNGVDDVYTAYPPFGRVDLFIACFSLSEIPLEERDLALAGCEFSRFLVAYAREYDGVDNELYFSLWGNNAVVHPCYPSVHYLVGEND